jgi:16S rRNA (adenine1518-N6/adenine1519-N6)-dimethyltransferase
MSDEGRENRETPGSSSSPVTRHSSLTSPAQVDALLRRHGLRPRKRWGQNFLIDRNTLRNVLRAAEVEPEDCILEIGPGLGTLTLELAQTARRVLAVEIDPLLVEILRAETVTDMANVEVIHGDALEIDLSRLLDGAAAVAGRAPARWKAVANIPYYITTPLIERLLGVKERLERIVLMVQREVASRLTAAPGSEEYGSLSVFAQYHAVPEVTARVSRTAFLPPPAVDSAIVRLRVRQEPAAAVRDERLFFQVVRAAFEQRRKTLLNALTTVPGLAREAAGAALAQAGIAPSRRGETLAVADFARLADAVADVRQG